MAQSVSQPFNPGSSSQHPDLDWSQARETITLLCLATAQIEAALRDAASSVDTLANSFTKIATDSKQVLDIANSVAAADNNSEQHNLLSSSAAELHSEIKNSVVSFQFHDRVSQKLAHVNKSLTLVADLIGDSGRLYQPSEWLSIQEEIAKSYTLECERRMFKKILEGATIREALTLYNPNEEIGQTDSSDNEDIELF